jgi:hypothetical protein
MDARVTALEIHMEYVRSDLAELKAGQKEMAKALAELSQELSAVNFALKALPTKNDLWAWKMQWLAIAPVGFATIVGGIIGGLDWLKTH